jgi:hypothetical protein
MRERRGTFGRTVGALATSIADAARGRQQRGEPRVVVHDEAGHSRLLDSGTAEYERLVETALALLEMVAEGRAPS